MLSHANGFGGTPVWRQLTISGSKPAVRTFHTAVYDASTNRMIIFGGNGSIQTFADSWVLINANGIGTPSWAPIGASSVNGVPTGRESHSAAYDPDNNIMMIFGGSNGNGWFGGPWVLTDANGL